MTTRLSEYAIISTASSFDEDDVAPDRKQRGHCEEICTLTSLTAPIDSDAAIVKEDRISEFQFLQANIPRFPAFPDPCALALA